MIQHWMASGLLCLLTLNAYAGGRSIETLSSVTQTGFENLVEDLGAALSYKAVTPAEPLGIFGFDIGAELTVSQLSADNVWNQVNGENGAVDTLHIARLHAHKGLPFGFDVGLSYGRAIDSNINVLGGEIRYSILEGTVLTPALAVRGTFSAMSGTDAMDLYTRGLELTVSKGVLMFTPYAGAGYLWTHGDPKQSSLNSVDTTQPRLYIGTNLSFLLLNAVLELERTGKSNAVSLKVGTRF